MKWPLIVMMVGALLTVYFTYNEYRVSKVSKKHFVTILVIDLLIVSGGVFLLLNEILR